MEFMLLTAVVGVAIACFRLERKIRRLEEQLRQQGKTLSETGERLEEHTLWEEGVDKSERLFREGLQNILNYGVM